MSITPWLDTICFDCTAKLRHLIFSHCHASLLIIDLGWNPSKNGKDWFQRRNLQLSPIMANSYSFMNKIGCLSRASTCPWTATTSNKKGANSWEISYSSFKTTVLKMISAPSTSLVCCNFSAGNRLNSNLSALLVKSPLIYPARTTRSRSRQVMKWIAASWYLRTRVKEWLPNCTAIRKRKGSFEITVQCATGIMLSPTVKKARCRGK